VLGEAQGAFHVERDAVTGATTCASRLAGLALIGRDGRTRSGAGEVRRHTLDSLRRRVRAARQAWEARRAAAQAARERRRRAELARAALLSEWTKGKPGSAE
jgi:hypothetical protein